MGEKMKKFEKNFILEIPMSKKNQNIQVVIE